ncbi:MAG: phage major capsid protein [Clostridiales bacterium]|nr:phage major capsid protein [Clostridiales bacterium]
MSKIQELTEKRKAVWEAAKAYLESKRGESGMVSEEDTATYRKMEADVENLSQQILILEEQEKRDRMMQAVNRAPLLTNPAEGMGAGFRASDAYAKAFWDVMRIKGKAVSNDLAVGTDTQGGYLVPDEFERTLVQALEEHDIMRQIARVIRTSSGELQIPVVATQGTASWVEEAGEIPTSDGSFGQVTLSAYKLATMIRVSQELLSDSSFPLETFLAQDFGRRIGDLEEEAFLVGDGNKKPTGVLLGASVGKTAASATAITFDEVMDLYHSLKSPYRNRAVFVTNDLTVKALRKLKDSNGQYLWQPSLVAGTPDTVLGRPVYVSSYMPLLAAEAKVMAFGDFSYYWINDRQGRTFDRLDEIFATTDQVGFKATQRVDGALVLPEAVQVLQMAE